RQPLHDRIAFSTHLQGINFQMSQPAHEILAQLHTCANLQELAQRLETLKDIEYYWLDLLIGICVKYGTTTSGSWGAAEIWHNALEPWSPWVR
ncbi:MAG: hypothetical protein ACRDH2_16665, partial [Anaerolineales bacterium]